ncbi:MAG: prolipoprotein diacylglyceryl transferase [Oscillospiraceae bacterium]
MFLTSPITFPNLGISVDPSPVALRVFGKDIYWYGIIIAVGFVLAVVYMMYRSKDFGVTSDDTLDLVLWTVPIGVICARLYYCIFYWELYADNPISMLYIWQGGLAIYGAVIGGTITVVVVSKVKKIRTGVFLDLASMGVLIGQIFGRWGNFMNREAHGSVTDSFFKMGLVDAAGQVTYYHPTFLYESVWNLVGFIGIHFLSKKKRKFDGEVFLLYIGWYGLGRAWIEGLRTDSLMLFSTGIRVSQLVAIVSFVAAAAVLAYVLLKKKPNPDDLLVNVRAREAAEAARAAVQAEESDNL